MTRLSTYELARLSKEGKSFSRAPSVQAMLATLSSIGDAVIATDAEGNVTVMNPVAEGLTGWTQADALGQPLANVFRLVNEATREPVEDPAATVLRLRAVVGRVSHGVLLSRTGREVPLDGSSAPILDDEGGVIGVVVVFRDVTRDSPAGRPDAIGLIEDISERKRLESELQAAKAAVEASNRAKAEFLANVSHEIRTPMNAILGMTELVLDTPLDEAQRQSLRTVKSAAASLLGIIDDLLDFSKIEAGKIALDHADFQLRALLGDTMRALAVRAHRKGLELVCNVAPDAPDALVGDAGRLRQVLINLVGNAIKFTSKGEVQVDVTCASRSAGDVELRFAVRDTGIGISLEKQASIFRAFEQEDMSTTRRYGGTGLGLTIAARFVEMMGGTITVESAPRRGSTFTFDARFQWREQAPAPTVARSHPALGRLRVLIVDDNRANREVLEQWLGGWRMESTGVRDGITAMDALWHGVSSGQPYALILLDARMPDTDGLTLAAKIRERAELAATRIILLCSGDRPQDVDRFRELRIDAHILKPIPQDELLDRIHEVMTRSADEGGAHPCR